MKDFKETKTEHNSQEVQKVTNALYEITYGLYVIGCWADNRPAGCIVNTCFQVTSEPPKLAVSLNKNNYTLDCIKKNPIFCISIIAENTVIGENCIIGEGEYADSSLSQKIYNCDLAIIGEGSVIPDGVTIGKNVAISGRTEDSDYPEGKLPSGDYIVKAGEI